MLKVCLSADQMQASGRDSDQTRRTFPVWTAHILRSCMKQKWECKKYLEFIKKINQPKLLLTQYSLQDTGWNVDILNRYQFSKLPQSSHILDLTAEFGTVKNIYKRFINVNLGNKFKICFKMYVLQFFYFKNLFPSPQLCFSKHEFAM